MAIQTYHGSCHCQRVRFEADLDLAAGTGKCNCTYCWKVRNWSIGIKPDAFRLLAGEGETGEYSFRPPDHGRHAAAHVFCKHCGIRVYTHGDIPAIGGKFVSVSLAALDDLPPARLAEAPVRYMNGRDDDWFHQPAETRHL